MNYKKLIGFGILIYVVVFLVASGFVVYDMSDTFIARTVTLLAVIIVVYLSGRNVRAGSSGEIMRYSFAWLMIVAIFDIIFTVLFTGWGIFLEWNIWIGYAVIALLPLLTVKKVQQAQQSPQEFQQPQI